MRYILIFGAFTCLLPVLISAGTYEEDKDIIKKSITQLHRTTRDLKDTTEDLKDTIKALNDTTNSGYKIFILCTKD